MSRSYFIKKLHSIHKSLLATLITLATSASLVGLAHAEELPKQTYLPLDMAQKAANTALQKCSTDGYRVSVAVVDRSGVIIVHLRASGAGPHTINSSVRKAYTAASMGRSTLELAEFIKDKPELHGLRNMDNQILLLGGGLPIKLNGELVGGIGVGGTPSAPADDACAKAGLEGIGAQ